MVSVATEEMKYEEALALAREIQKKEPGNKIIKEYISTIQTLLRQQGN